jgi:two-component system, LytTR family, response regulator
MTTLNVILIDDERRVRNHLKNTLLECGDVHIVGEADDVASARALVSAHPEIDGIFLDIQLPGGTGFDVVSEIQDMQKVVFVTAYDQYAIRAFNVNALDYLLKPVVPERLSQSLERLRTHQEVSTRKQTSALATPPPVPVVTKAAPNPPHLLVSAETVTNTVLMENDQLLLKVGAKNKFCSVKDVVFVRSADNYTEVHCSDGTLSLMRKTLEEWAVVLPSAVFVRIHRSAMINIRYISETEQDIGGRLLIRLRGVEEELTASRGYAITLKEVLSK